MSVSATVWHIDVSMAQWHKQYQTLDTQNKFIVGFCLFMGFDDSKKN